MIERYTLPEMAQIWSEENKYKIWLEIEILACEAQVQLGIAPKEIIPEIRNKAKIDIKRINEIEQTTKHDVIAFLTSIEEQVGEASRFIHHGMTSSDVLDTALAVQAKQAGELILQELRNLEQVLIKRAREHKYTICIGRSHGIHAEPMTFGLKFALWLDECRRNIKRLEDSINEIAVGKISGAVGTYEHIPPFIEEYVCEKLGLHPSIISTQVVQRDRHAQFLHTLAMIGSLLEKIATEIRHLQRTEVLEAEEYFAKGQKGSSAMPHKRNPISSENICGQARLLRTNALAAIENNALWHERDISHSSVERIIFPDSTISCHYILRRAINLLENLIVYPDNMKKNLDITLGLYNSQKVLLALARKGLKRQVAYELVQKSAMRTWNEHIPFIQSLKENSALMSHFSENELEKLFDFKEIFKSVDYIYSKLNI
jgi:adenylosuccinate lyase